MTTQKPTTPCHNTMNHPITPPTELVSKWIDLLASRSEEDVLIFATQWGADRELEACCEWLEINYNTPRASHPLRTIRRPEPPTLKEQALAVLGEWSASEFRHVDVENKICADMDIIRRALEELPND